MSLHPLWQQYTGLIPSLNKVSSLLEDCAGESPVGIQKDLGRLLGNPGKMLRPAFTVLASAWGSPSEGIIKAAAAMELLHVASLVHDDVLDKAVKRRGLTTLHTTLGVKKAVLTGDYLMFRAAKMAADEYDKRFLPLLINSMDRLCTSEIDQDFNNYRMNISRGQYFGRIRGKTAELFGLSCLAGGLTSGCSEETARKLYDLGISFGMAFQIEDDILDYTGDSQCLGKKTGKDLRSGIPTLPLIEALEAGDKRVMKLCSGPVLKILPGVVRRAVISGGYVEKAAETAAAYRNEALEILERLPETEGSNQFRSLIAKMEARTF